MRGRDLDGYGRIHVFGVGYHASKISYIAHKGSVPEGMVVMHTCDNPPCVNPDHLTLGTWRDNTQDSISKGRFFKNAKWNK